MAIRRCKFVVAPYSGFSRRMKTAYRKKDRFNYITLDNGRWKRIYQFLAGKRPIPDNR